MKNSYWFVFLLFEKFLDFFIFMSLFVIFNVTIILVHGYKNTETAKATIKC